MHEKTKVTIDEDKKGVLWLRASPVNLVNLVVSISGEKVWIWACKKGCNEEGKNVFNMKLIKEGDRWSISNLESEEVEKFAKFKKEKA